HVGHAVVNGEFHGRIRCEKKIEVHGRGRIFGTIIAPKIMIDESAYLQAECRTEEAPVSAEPAAEDKESE
ncbi:MAG: polymer-forming cytoskeletal protein, partial [Acidobacteria bacterium]|nr:polymer-forming cytoskeletal protein [Acidobacteriota bacterium]